MEQQESSPAQASPARIHCCSPPSSPPPIPRLDLTVPAYGRRYLLLRQEDLLEEPRLLAAHLFHWLVGDEAVLDYNHHPPIVETGNGALLPAGYVDLATTKLPPKLEGFLSRVVDGSASQLSPASAAGDVVGDSASPGVGGEALPAACWAAVDALGYQRWPVRGVGPVVPVPGGRSATDRKSVV